MHAQTIRADGIDWPIETYLDALDFKRVNPFEIPQLQHQVRVVTVTGEGELAPPTFADQVRWHDVLAYRYIEHGPETILCRLCAEPVGRTDFDDICESCEDEGEPWF
ncbi:hypothetical protein [Sphingomonas oligophenolica]|uniref:Uncharacterized protein n=1 Tax=Sphingomonas oligophenolica TaxID=301154 RepID=A0A502CPD0_9SPHN|nr:hypothetical protein [Sphingomonas oligophenolica]TPG14390.1 hypothetical protein EAH84_03520 [Sphingomonas oligophenolica]